MNKDTLYHYAAATPERVRITSKSLGLDYEMSPASCRSILNISDFIELSQLPIFDHVEMLLSNNQAFCVFDGKEVEITGWVDADNFDKGVTV